MPNMQEARELMDAAIEVLRDNGGELPYEDFLAALRAEGLHDAIAFVPRLRNIGSVKFKLALGESGAKIHTVRLAEGDWQW